MLEKRIEVLEEVLTAGFKKVDLNFEALGKEIRQIHGQIEVLNKKVDLLRGDTSEGFDDVGSKLENLSQEISKIGLVTNYNEEYSNLKTIKN